MTARNTRPATMPASDVMPWEATRRWARPVCQHCGRSTRRPAPVSDAGHLDLYHLPSGWSVAPYSSTVEHGDGSTGSLYTCPDCNRRRQRGERLTRKADRR